MQVLVFINSYCIYITDPVGQGHSVLLECDKPVAGRYLVVYLNYTEALTICELQVYSREYLETRSLG